MSNVPREWVIEIRATNPTVAQIVVAGVPGISHVITRAIWRITSSNNAAVSQFLAQILDGVTAVYSDLLGLSATAATEIGADEIDRELSVFGTQGNALTVNFTAAPLVNQSHIIVVYGYSV